MDLKRDDFRVLISFSSIHEFIVHRCNNGYNNICIPIFFRMAKSRCSKTSKESFAVFYFLFYQRNTCPVEITTVPTHVCKHEHGELYSMVKPQRDVD